ncbi:MAG: hypothetical protein A4E63_02438 [Syntrophorhabdus sp. PtaU1.Bin050]|nr:MAG: hypothetical protein A4E63_02438 [Syntrophorhabdus sp. PtaU1.Bin050]
MRKNDAIATTRAGGRQIAEIIVKDSILAVLSIIIILILFGVRPSFAELSVIELDMAGNNALNITRSTDLSATGTLSGGTNFWSWTLDGGLSTYFNYAMLTFDTANFTLSGNGFGAVTGTVNYQSNLSKVIVLGVTFPQNGATYSGDIAFTYAGGSDTGFTQKGGSGTFTMSVPEPPMALMLFAASLFVIGLTRNFKRFRTSHSELPTATPDVRASCRDK